MARDAMTEAMFLEHLRLAPAAGDGRAAARRPGRRSAASSATWRARRSRRSCAGRPGEALRGGRPAPRRSVRALHATSACRNGCVDERGFAVAAGDPPPAAGQAPPQPRRDQGHCSATNTCCCGSTRSGRSRASRSCCPTTRSAEARGWKAVIRRVIDASGVLPAEGRRRLKRHRRSCSAAPAKPARRRRRSTEVA